MLIGVKKADTELGIMNGMESKEQNQYAMVVFHGLCASWMLEADLVLLSQRIYSLTGKNAVRELVRIIGGVDWFS